MVEPNADERERAMGFPTGTTNVPGISEQQRRYLLGQAMDLNCLTWIVSLLVAEQKRLASSLTGCMDFYELRAAGEPFVSVKVTDKVVGGERALAPHPWNMWGTANIFATSKAEDLHYGVENQSQGSRLAHQRIDLEEVVEEMFVEEQIAIQMVEIDKLGQLEGLGGVIEVEGDKFPPPGIQ